MNFISVASIFVIVDFQIGDTLHNLITDVAAIGSVEYTANYTVHKCSFVVSAVNIHPVRLMDL